MNPNFKPFYRILFIIPLLIISSTAWLQDETSHLYFDGVNDYVETHNTQLDYFNDDFTFEAVIKGNEDDQGTDPTIISNRWSHIKGSAFYFKSMGDGVRALCFSNRGEEWYIPNNGSVGSLLDGTCHHVAVVRKEGDLYFYADGVLFGVDYADGCANNLQGFTSIWIGRDHVYGNEFKGVIGNVRIWKSARTSTELAENMHGGIDGFEYSLRGCWDLNEGDGQNIYCKYMLSWSCFLGTDEFIEGDGYDPDWFEGDYCSNIHDYGDGDDDGWVEEEEEEDGDEDEDEDEDEGGDGDDTAALTKLDNKLLKLYPNPVLDNNLTVDFGANLSNVEFTLVSISGQEVYNYKVTKNTSIVILNIRDITNGVYLLKIQSEDRLITKKIVVR